VEKKRGPPLSSPQEKCVGGHKEERGEKKGPGKIMAHNPLLEREGLTPK